MRLDINSSEKIEASRPFSKLASKFRYNKRNVRRLPKGTSTTSIFQKVINDPDVTFGAPDKDGNQDIMYRGKNVGWINPGTDKGYIDNVAYDKLYDKANPSDKWKDDEIIMANESITAAEGASGLGELKSAIEKALDDDSCEAIVKYAVSEDGDFEDVEFFDAKTFFDMYSNTDPQEFAEAFYEGADVDSNGDSANPYSKYFRFVDSVIDSTDDPGAYYYDEYFDEIVDYVMNHLDYTNYPEAIQSIINAYNEYSNSEDLKE